MYVNVYDVAQEYGGPEEGGWFYTTGVPIESYWVPLPQRLAALVAAWLRNRLSRDPSTKGSGWWFPSWNGVGDPDAGCRYSKGLVVMTEPHPARYFPTERPHYE